MSTSNRLGRSVDRARQLATILDKERDMNEEEAKLEKMYLKELQTVQSRSVILMRALGLFYTALGGFASSAVVSLIGAILVAYVHNIVVTMVEGLAVLVGMGGVGSLIYGSFLLIRETRLAVAVLEEQTELLQERVAKRIKDAKLS